MKTNTKNKLFLLLILLVCMLLIPLISVQKNKGATVNTNSLETNARAYKPPFKNSCFTILDEHSNEILKIPEKEMIYSTVASEMPARFENEALKAQAVASYTYFCHLRKTKPQTQEYDFKINPHKGINFISEEKMRENWGDSFDEYSGKIKNAVDEVFGEQITYEGEPIFAAYHAISSGITEKSSDIFGGSLPYLTNVQSEGDKLAKGYETRTEFSKEEFKKILSDNNSKCNLGNNPKDCIKNYERTPAGSVKKVFINSTEFKGADIRALFNLRSSNFIVDYNPQEDKLIITTFGYGHGVGMSQCGANYLAKQGKNYKEILAWYYPNTKLV